MIRELFKKLCNMVLSQSESESITMNTFQVAKTFCEISDWSLTNLQLQKMLYIAHRVYLGRTGKPLVDGSFQAWDYGPVMPNVYKECKMYGNRPIQSAFLLSKGLPECPEREMVEEAYEHLKEFTGGQLVSLTHREDGAWAKCYIPGARDVTIPNDLIKQEYDDIKSSN